MKFFSTFLASLLALFTGAFLIFLFVLIGVASSSSEPEPYIRDGSVLTLELSGGLPARATGDPFEELLSGTTKTPVSVASLRSVLEKAAADDRIAGIWMQVNMLNASWSNLQEAHALLTKFRESGKFIYASTNDLGFDETGYYLSTAADSVFGAPEAYFEFNGFVVQVSHYAELLDRIGVKPEIFRVGKYKSAVEPFLYPESSPESREQLGALLTRFKAEFVEKVAAKTGKTAAELDALMDELYTGSIAEGVEAGLLDGIAYPEDMERMILARLGEDENEELETVSFSRYAKTSRKKAGLEEVDSENRIAVIYASGTIMPDLGQDSPFDGASGITYGDIDDILDDVDGEEAVKAVVLHIDSPGGSAATSELIWNRLRETAKDKPVVAVMGPVAASGGYYIAMGADTVVASPNTITGSIGIFRTMFDAEELMNDRLGITFSEIQTDPHADILQMTRPLTNSERRALQRVTDQGYERFLQVVSMSRGMSRDEVHEVAQGRVWTGQDAMSAGLVDVLGDLQTGLSLAAERAGIDTYQLDVYPRKKDVFEALFDSGNETMARWLGALLPEPAADLLRTGPGGLDALKGNGNMALLPYHITVR